MLKLGFQHGIAERTLQNYIIRWAKVGCRRFWRAVVAAEFKIGFRPLSSRFFQPQLLPRPHIYGF